MTEYIYCTIILYYITGVIESKDCAAAVGVPNLGDVPGDVPAPGVPG